MSKATTVLVPGVSVTLPPAGNISFEIEQGQRFKMTQPEGEQVADLISFNRDDPRELLSMHGSRAVNLNWKLTKPHVLYSNRTREMWRIDEDLTGENYCGGGYCSEHLNMMRYGEKGKGAPTCQQNLEQAVRGYGMDRWNFNVDACFNVFMTVAYDADGKWEIREAKGKVGDYITMTALMPQIVAISNCPILFNACNNFKLKPLTLEILK
ncbi:MAG: urea carboxylase-associated family protein [Alphaproteobacteria bacterium]|nr:urea carboxylase-associated family protein [Alphaproteobacteria bacterium]